MVDGCGGEAGAVVWLVVRSGWWVVNGGGLHIVFFSNGFSGMKVSQIGFMIMLWFPNGFIACVASVFGVLVCEREN